MLKGLLKNKTVSYLLSFGPDKIATGLALGLILVPTLVEAQAINGEINKVADAVHMEFKGRSHWDYEVKKTGPKEITVTLPEIDDGTLARLQSWSDVLVNSVKWQQNSNGKHEVIFKLNDEKIESFDYLTDEPSRLIVDFYKSSETPIQPVVENKEASVKKDILTALPAKKKVVTSDGYSKKDRKPASGEILTGPKGEANKDNDEEKKSGLPLFGVYDGGDPEFSRFKIKPYEISEEAIISSQQNIYLKFPMLKMENNRLAELMSDPPEYGILPKNSQENKEAQFLFVLYKKNRMAAFLKTYDYFMKKYPESEYKEIFNNMAAETYYKLWQRDGNIVDFEKSKKIYQQLISRNPQSPLAERNQLIVAYMHLYRKDGLQTIQSFQNFIKDHPQSPERDTAYKALAEGYLVLNKYSDALEAYDALEKKADKALASIEAVYRQGDVYFSNKDYENAIKAYKNAIKEHPKQQATFPNAYYNMAESYFWLGKHQEGLDNYIKFLQLFPAHDFGGYAMTRIGELLEIMGADRSKVMGAFLESHFRFRLNPGAEIARIRLISQRMQVMKEKELKKSLEEMKEISKKSQLPKIEEFITLMVADGMLRRKEFETALGDLLSYYQSNPTSANPQYFKTRILRSISELIREDVEKKDFLAALKENGKYSSTWLRNSDRIDIPYFVAKSYEMAGVNNEAEKIYNKILDHRIQIVGKREEIEKRVNEHLPNVEQIKLRLAAIYTQKRMYQEAAQKLSEIRDPSQLDSEEKIESVELGATVAEERGDVQKAMSNLNQLITSWKEKPQLLAHPYLRLAKLQYKDKQYITTEETLKKLEDLQSESYKLNEDVKAQMLETRGDALLAQNKDMAAVEVYSQLLNEFENTKPLSAIRYKVGHILFERGDIKGAEKIWSNLNAEKSPLYVRLSKEKLANAQWRDDYKKYIDRIPAMSTYK